MPGSRSRSPAASRPCRSSTSTSSPTRRRSSSRPSTRSARWPGGTRRSCAPSWRTSRSTTPGSLALLGDLAGNDPKAGLTDPDEVPEPPEEPYVKPGELYVLGDHRLLCGDATSADDVARLLDGAAPTLLATDPPYGVQLDQTWRDGVYNGRVSGSGLGRRSMRAEKPYMMRETRTPARGATPARHGRHAAGHRNTTIAGDTRADWSEAFALVPSLQVGYVWYAAPTPSRCVQGLLGDRLRARQPDHLGQGPLRRWAAPGTTGPTSPALVVRKARRAEPVHRRARPGDDLASTPARR